MKSVYAAAIVSAIVMSASTVSAQCACNPTDSVCLSNCVGTTQSCITECQNNRECYQSCISNHWPGAESGYSEPSTMMPISTWMESSTTTWEITPTSSWSSVWSEYSSWATSATPTWSSSMMWPSQSGAWPSSSGSSWSASYTGSMPGASRSALPTSRSAATTTQISKIVFGLGLACAAYILQ